MQKNIFVAKFPKKHKFLILLENLTIIVTGINHGKVTITIISHEV